MALSKGKSKKPYTSPRLTRYGDLKTLTKGGQRTKTEQSGAASTNKTKAGAGPG